MTRFTRTDVESALNSIAISAKMQGLLPWEAQLTFTPSPKAIVAVQADGGNLVQVPTPFLPEFEEKDTIKDVMRALAATFRVLRATEDKVPSHVPTDGDAEESPIYYDTFVEDDETPVEYLPFKDDTARIIDEVQGGVIAYCHVGTADRIVEALRK